MKKLYTLFAAATLALAANAGEAAQPDTWYISGSFDGWSGGNNAADHDFTGTDVLSVTLPTLPVGADFLIVKTDADGSPDFKTKVGNNGSDITYNTPYTGVVGADNIIFSGEEAGNWLDVTVQFNPSNNEILITGGTFESVSSFPFAVAGAFNEWSTTANSDMTDSETGVAQVIVNAWPGGEFKIVSNGKWLTLDTENPVILPTKAYSEWVDAPQNMTLPSTANGKDITFDWNYNTKTLIVNYEGGEIVETVYYVYGDVNGIAKKDALANEALKMTSDGSGIYTFNFTSLATGFCINEGTISSCIGNSFDELVLGDALDVYTDDDAIIFADDVETVVDGTITFDSENSEIVVTGTPSSIANVAADAANGAAVYYNLQGVRVANPQGVVIMKAGNQVSKVIR